MRCKGRVNEISKEESIKEDEMLSKKKDMDTKKIQKHQKQYEEFCL